MFIYIKNILQLLLAPAKGWEDLLAVRANADTLLKHLVYPLMIVASLSVFFQMVYEPEPDFAISLIRAIVVFVSLFVTYYFALVMCKSLLYKMCADEPLERLYSVVIAYSVALMSIAMIVCNLLPLKEWLRYLLPMAVALIMWKSESPVGVKPEYTFAYILFCLASVIIPPVLIQSLFDMVL